MGGYSYFWHSNNSIATFIIIRLSPKEWETVEDQPRGNKLKHYKKGKVFKYKKPTGCSTEPYHLLSVTFSLMDLVDSNQVA